MDKLATVQRFWLEVPPARPLREVSGFLHLIDGLGWIAGSYAAWLSTAWPDQPTPNDIDIFAESSDAAEMIADRLRFKYQQQQTDNGLVISIPARARCRPIQIIRPMADWRDFPADILHSFDMTVCSALLLNRKTVLIDEGVGGTFARILRISDPLKTLERILKYQRRGIVFEPWEILKVLRAWAELSPERREAIEQATMARYDREAEVMDVYAYVDDSEYWDAE